MFHRDYFSVFITEVAKGATKHARSKEAKRKRSTKYKKNKKAKRRADEEMKAKAREDEFMTVKLKLLESNRKLRQNVVNRNTSAAFSGVAAKGTQVMCKNKNKFLASKLSGDFKLRENSITFPNCGPILGEGTSATVKVGYFSQLDIDVAVKMPKLDAFDALSEARILCTLNGNILFPYVFGVHQKCLVLELIASKVDGVYVSRTVHSELNYMDSDMSVKHWLIFSELLGQAVQSLHDKYILHNDLKEDNVLIRIKAGAFLPVVTDFGKATHALNPQRYFLNQSDRERYNSKHRHSAHELRNINGSSQSYMTDCYSLRRVYKAVGYSRCIDILKFLGHKMKHQSLTERRGIKEALLYLKASL